MPVHVALLRSVNVGGRSLPSAELRALCAGLGFDRVRTYIQSGNVVFDDPSAEEEPLRARIEEALAAAAGFPVPVLLRSPADLRHVVDRQPFAARGAAPRQLHVSFLAGPPAPGGADRLERDALRHAPDECRLGVREVYLYCPDGYGRSKLTPAFLEARLRVPTTTRNWNTVLQLLAMAEA